MRSAVVYDTTPRVRGLQRAAGQRSRRGRYNPACAGTTYSCRRLRAQSPIQPRVCGDYIGHWIYNIANLDTTPRVRGLRAHIVIRAQLQRYNPACAGTTYPASWSILPTPIQPRVCGDYSLRSWRNALSCDTTPRVRGLPYAADIVTNSGRYNPACAGTTQTSYVLSGMYSIQPRVCGDYFNSSSI